jgi:hypothetical protein
MAAAVVNSSSRRERVFGDMRVLLVNLTWNNGDTYATGFKAVKSAQFEPTTNASCGLTRATGANGQVTITLVSGGSLTGDLQIFGFA